MVLVFEEILQGSDIHEDEMLQLHDEKPVLELRGCFSSFNAPVFKRYGVLLLFMPCKNQQRPITYKTRQCAELLNNKSFHGYIFEWQAFTDIYTGNPCDMFCYVPRLGYNTQPQPSYRDGTDCLDPYQKKHGEVTSDAYYRCVGGKCLEFGCDGKLDTAGKVDCHVTSTTSAATKPTAAPTMPTPSATTTPRVEDHTKPVRKPEVVTAAAEKTEAATTKKAIVTHPTAGYPPHTEATLVATSGIAVDGGWSEWAWSACSRSCGGGISTRTRACDNPRPSNGGSICFGDTEQLQLCNEKPCETSQYAHKQQQCMRELGTRAFAGRTFKWDPYFGHGDHPCVMWCRVATYGYTLQPKLYYDDGTDCAGHKPIDVTHVFHRCHSGKCMKFGCDGKVNSTVTTDSCGVCGGNGASCKQMQDVPKGR
ncbi:PREDICTED: uncharacterized protein LOC106818579 [Priapulus caudatus]|uniref:Uncharacterized protein LOC106818579 n=1 Tax=Priapulus caudatus TaxID=37621 RepID=A0ABM1F2U1_PRICU|nr:PREDICTED: uncharacterized protein LOC106818579 [Priapulus caudatus]